MKNILRKKFFATGIGSVPHQDPMEAVRQILKSFQDIPFWPQLPRKSFLESMYAQFIQGFPKVVIDEVRKTLWVDTSKDFMTQIEKTYQKILDNDLEYFSTDHAHASGLFELLERVKSISKNKIAFVKGQIIGPISFGLSLTDERKRSVLYHSELKDIIHAMLALKIKWQIRKIKKAFKRVIIFIDEPYLSSVGSGYINVKAHEAEEMLKELVKTVHAEGALAGIHCCGNTDWPLVLKTGIDILNFDAYEYMKSISLYPRELGAFLDKDGFIAWGIVPTSKAIANEDAEGLIKRLEEGIDLLAGKGISKEKLLESMLITPSCGCGTMEIEEAERVFDLTAEISGLLKRKYA